MKKICLITVFILAIALMFGMVGCDNLKMDDDSEVGLTIDGAYNFTASAKLTEKTTYTSASEIAAMIESVSDGMVTASSISDKIIAEGSASYKLELTEIPKDVSLSDYLERVESDYLASFEGWTAFPDAPVVYVTKDGKDVLVILDHDGKSAEVKIYVLYFRAGSVSEVAASVGGQGGNENGSSNGNSGNSNGNNSSGSISGGTETTVTIREAYDFTAQCELIERLEIVSAADIASMIESSSEGMVRAEDIIGMVVPRGCVVYRIRLTNSADVNSSNYFEKLEERYFFAFSGWRTFPDAPVRYTFKDGKDEVVFLTEGKTSDEIDVVIVFFEEGSVDAILSAIRQGNNGSSGGSSGGSTHGTVDGGNKDKESGNGGTIGGESGGNEGEGQGGEGQGEAVPPASVRYSIIDIDKEGNEQPYMSNTVAYGSEMKFDWCEYVVFYDKAFKEEIDPNTAIKMERDLVVYRRDYYNKAPVFVTIHHIINGIEENSKLEHFTFYRGKIVKDSANTRGGELYALYRDGGKGEYLFANGAIVIHDEDDKANWYAFRDDPLYHKVTFMVGESDIGTTLIYDGTYLGEYSASALAGRTEYRIKDCTGYGTAVTRDMVVTITDYQRVDQFPITLNMCYGGEVKYVETLYVPTFSAEEEGYEIGAGMGYYSDINFRELFDGFIKTAHTFYIRIPVNLD